MIQMEVLQQAGIDYNAGVKRFMNDKGLYEAILTAFAGEDVLERAQAAYRAGNREELRRVVHEAKGSGGNAGLDVVYVPTCAFMELLRSESYTDDELAAAYGRFETAYETTRSAIKKALGL